MSELLNDGTCKGCGYYKYHLDKEGYCFWCNGELFGEEDE